MLRCGYTCCLNSCCLNALLLNEFLGLRIDLRESAAQRTVCCGCLTISRSSGVGLPGGVCTCSISGCALCSEAGLSALDLVNEAVIASCGYIAVLCDASGLSHIARVNLAKRCARARAAIERCCAACEGCFEFLALSDSGVDCSLSSGYLSLCVFKCNACSVILLGKYTNTHGLAVDLSAKCSGLSLLAGDRCRSPSGRNGC